MHNLLLIESTNQSTRTFIIVISKLFFQITLNTNVHYFENALLAEGIENLTQLVANSDIHP